MLTSTLSGAIIQHINLMKELVNSMKTTAIQHNLFRHSNQGWAIATVQLRGSECEMISPKYDDTRASLICEDNR